MKKYKIIMLFVNLTFYFNLTLAMEKTENLEYKNSSNEEFNNEKLNDILITQADKDLIKKYLKKLSNTNEDILNKITDKIIKDVENFYLHNTNAKIFNYEFRFNNHKKNKINFIFKKQENIIKLLSFSESKPEKLRIEVGEKILSKLKNIWESLEKGQNFLVEQNFEHIANNFKNEINQQIKENPFKEKYFYKEELTLIPKKQNLQIKKIQIIFNLFESKQFKEKLKLNVELKNLK